MAKWIKLYQVDTETEYVQRAVSADLIKEYNCQRMPDGRFAINLSWDRPLSYGSGYTKTGDTLIFETQKEMENWIADNL